MEILARFVAREERARLRALRAELDSLVRLVDSFYEILGPRSWIFHDSLPLSDLRVLFRRTQDPEVVEAGLIDLYREDGRMGDLARKLRSRPSLSEREHQTNRALRHYHADEFDSCTLHLISVMDGFVNDFEPAIRRGLVSRVPEDMVAWDSVVGHHLGLTHTLKSFQRTFRKRVDEEVTEVYRHGIVHGMVVRFDNVVVATKAWNMLFAVSDWARATELSQLPRETQPSFRDVARDLLRHAKDEGYRKNFLASTVMATGPGLGDLQVVHRARAFLEAWKAHRWGLVAEGFSLEQRQRRGTTGQQAEWVKQVYSPYSLDGYEIEAVRFPQASAADIQGMIEINGARGAMQIRWIFARPDGALALPGDEGAEWSIGVYAPHTFLADGSTGSARAE